MSRRAPRTVSLALSLTRRASLAIISIGVAACSGAAFDGAIYRSGEVAFRVGPIPATWQRMDAEGAALAFRDHEAQSTIAVGGRCGQDGDDVPLSALTGHLFIRFTDRNTALEEVVPFDGREALHTVITAKLDGVPKSFDVWVLKKDGCVYDLYLLSPPERFDANVVPFRAFVSGFATVPRSD